MTFADPPFNLKKKYNGYKDSLEFKEYIEWCDKWIGEMVRITKSTGSIQIQKLVDRGLVFIWERSEE